MLSTGVFLSELASETISEVKVSLGSPIITNHLFSQRLHSTGTDSGNRRDCNFKGLGGEDAVCRKCQSFLPNQIICSNCCD